MPELPEVEVVRVDLDAVLLGRTISRVEVGRDRAIRREPDAAAFVAALTGATVVTTSRVGKFVVVHFDPAHSDVVVIHLGMSGQLRVVDDASVPRPAHTHVVWRLDDGREVRFVDPRTFGQMYRSPIAGADRLRPRALEHLGPDALLELDGPEVLGRALAGRRVRVKTRLMDQTALAGVGNIYSDEILFRAGVAGSRAAGSLTDSEVARVHDACGAVLHAAVGAGGSSLADAQYVDLYGRTGRYQHAHAVHAPGFRARYVGRRSNVSGWAGALGTGAPGARRDRGRATAGGDLGSGARRVVPGLLLPGGQARGVAGWVRNRPDGRVEAAFEGAPDAVEALVAWCRVGPQRANVVRVEVIDEMPTGARGFDIR